MVATSFGKVRGKQLSTSAGFKIDGFFAVPYGEIPERFSRSIPKKPWGDVYDATTPQTGCPIYQSEGTSGEVNGQEDCLHLVILRSANSSVPKRPVIFWPKSGHSQWKVDALAEVMALGDAFLNKDVVVIRPNYRTGSLGFWSVGMPDAPGNYGLWDLLLALQWVHTEIQSFGGDPDKVTLMGHGFDAAMVEFVSMSMHAKDLFAGVIAMSGSAFNPYFQLPDQSFKERSGDLSNIVGCDGEAATDSAVVTCLRDALLVDILRAEWKISDGRHNPYLWIPRVDDIVEGGGFIPEPIQFLALQRPHVPLMIGVARNELAWQLIGQRSLNENQSLDALQTSLNHPKSVLEQCKEMIEMVRPVFKFPQIVVELCLQEFAENELLLSQSDSSLTWLEQVVRSTSSFWQTAPAAKSILYALQGGNQQVYAYILDYKRTQNNWWNTLGSFHGLDELFLAYDPGVVLSRYPELRYKAEATDIVFKQLITTLWANFAKFQHPTPTANNVVVWEPVKSARIEHFSLKVNPLPLSGFSEDSTYFWNRLVPAVQQTLANYSSGSARALTSVRLSKDFVKENSGFLLIPKQGNENLPIRRIMPFMFNRN